MKRPHDNKDSVKEVNLTTKGITRNTLNKRKRSKTNSDSKEVLAKSEETTRSKLSVLNTLKCKTYNRDYTTKNC
jgi:hypothetical protein